MERINIFVPVYFRETTVRKCVEALLETRESDGYEVRLILVDNRSDDSLRDYLREVGKEDLVKVVLLDRNMGKARAINDAADRFREFDWFINCDSDIFPLEKGWPGKLADCFKQVSRAGMVSTEYGKVNNPMPVQPKRARVSIAGKDEVFHFGGQVAGGCFLTSSAIWKHLGYRASGVYGGVDGMFRQAVAESLQKKCGYVTGVKVLHLDDREEFAD
jgi:glycosyltransferase involved in cell wall biosynthesis